jgi:hypothetical protein
VNDLKLLIPLRISVKYPIKIIFRKILTFLQAAFAKMEVAANFASGIRKVDVALL